MFLTPKNQNNLNTSLYFISYFHSTFWPDIWNSANLKNGLRLSLMQTICVQRDVGKKWWASRAQELKF